MTSGAGLRRAFEILQRALKDNVAVIRPHQPPPEQTGALVVRLERAPQPPLALRLVPWRDAETGGDADDVVWVLDRQDGQAAARLRRQGVSHVDLRGAVYLSLPWLLVDRTGVKAVSSPTERARANPFSDRNSLVVRVMLDQPRRVWGVRELASAAGVTPGTVSKVVRQLQADDLVRASGSLRTSEIRLSDPHRLLRRWTRVYDWSSNESFAFYAPVGDPARFLRRLAKPLGKRRWALTMQAGASLLAPHATWERIHAYVDVTDPEEIAALASEAGWDAGADGRLVLARPYHRTSAWHGMREVNGLPVVSTLQLVLDLWDYPLRGREQAEHMMETIVTPRAATPQAEPIDV